MGMLSVVLGSQVGLALSVPQFSCLEVGMNVRSPFAVCVHLRTTGGASKHCEGSKADSVTGRKEESNGREKTCSPPGQYQGPRSKIIILERWNCLRIRN